MLLQYASPSVSESFRAKKTSVRTNHLLLFTLDHSLEESGLVAVYGCRPS
jgi:hypothetical protein